MSERSPPTGLGNIRVLLVDNEQDLLVTAKMILEEKSGFQVETATSADGAAQLLAEAH